MPVVYEVQAPSDPPSPACPRPLPVPRGATLPVPRPMPPPVPPPDPRPTFVKIKLSYRSLSGNITRLVTFAKKPTWFELASRVEALTGFPRSSVAVTYLDR
jgi:hypothetical protein